MRQHNRENTVKTYNTRNKTKINANQNQYNKKNRKKINEKAITRRKNNTENKTAYDRFMAFKKDTKDGPIYICLCCDRAMFKAGVEILDKAAVVKLFQKCPANIIHQATSFKIRKPSKLSRNLNKKILCKNCFTSLKNKKCPRMSASNGLNLDPIPEELKLTDLEMQLIAKNLLFIKIFKMKKSGMLSSMSTITNMLF